MITEWENMKLIAKTCFTSKSFQKYIAALKPENLRTWRICDIIEYAPISIQKKSELFRILSESQNIKDVILAEQAFYKTADLTPDRQKRELSRIRKRISDNDFRKKYKIYQEIISSLDGSDSIYLLKGFTFNENTYVPTQEFEIPYLSYNTALADAKKKQKELEKYDDCCWLELEKWDYDKQKHPRKSFECTIHDGEILYFVQRKANGGTKYDNFFPGINLNIPVPFKVGDIVTVDIRPFAPITHALILSVGDNNDCCCVQALYYNGNGEWNSGAVKHSAIFRNGAGAISPLYSMDIFKGELKDEESFLARAQDFLNGDADKGDYLVTELFMSKKKDISAIEKMFSKYSVRWEENITKQFQRKKKKSVQNIVEIVDITT